jgi:hypothetical protein
VPTLGSGMDTVTLDSGACEALIGMAQSECCDVQREGLQALASASATSDNQLRLIKERDELGGPACPGARFPR